jgi:hypothetical protein
MWLAPTLLLSIPVLTRPFPSLPSLPLPPSHPPSLPPSFPSLLPLSPSLPPIQTPFYSGDRVELYKLVLRGYFTVPRGVSPRAKSLIYRVSIMGAEHSLRILIRGQWVGWSL